MKTIAITVDEPTLVLLDELVVASPHLRNRSACVRQAIREYAERQRRYELEERDRVILHRQRGRVKRQARALIAEQARA